MADVKLVPSEKLSKAELVKLRSRQLRGNIARDLGETQTPFDNEGYALLKFHGVYQGYDRDTATERKQRGEEKEWQFMVRGRIPGGRLTAVQYLALDDIAGTYADDTLRITTRQGLQFHGVVKAGLKQTIAAINAAALTTLAACGDVVRNVMTVPVPIRDAVHERLEADARRLSTYLLPKSEGYLQIWVDGSPYAVDEVPSSGAGTSLTESAVDPLYGERYLPRKFKIGLVVPQDNTVDVLVNDLAIVALFEGEALQGYNFFLGGGHGMTHNKPNTYPRMATPVAFILAPDLLEAAAAVVKLHRDHGDRTNRKHARLKYAIAEHGEDWARARLSEYLGKELEPCREMPAFAVPDHLGWREQGDGKLFLGIPVPSGRITDAGPAQIRTALRIIMQRFAPAPILTPAQDIILSDVDPADRDGIDAVLGEHGVIAASSLSPASRWALACPALPTCGLALTEAERVREEIVCSIEGALARHGLLQERLSIRITGCPNGCARPYSGDIGIVGRMPDHYALFVGGDFEGTRLNIPLADKLTQPQLASTLDPLFGLFAAQRHAGEGFGNFCYRLGIPALQNELDLGVKGAA